MKKSILLVIAFLITVPVFAQDIFSYLTDNYADNNGFSATKITNDMFDLYLKKKNIEKESPVFTTLQKLDNILIVSQNNFESDDKIDLTNIHDDILSNYQDEDYLLFKTEKRMGEDIKVYLKKDSEKINSLALVTASEKLVHLVEMNGDIDLANLSELSKVLNLRGLEALYKVNGTSPLPYFSGQSTFFAPEYKFNFDSNNWKIFNEDVFNELNENIEGQNFLNDEQRTLLENKAKEYSQRQSEMAKKYLEFAEQYGRTPIFLTYPEAKDYKYYINGKEASLEEIKELDKEKILTIDISKDEKNERNEIRFTTKK